MTNIKLKATVFAAAISLFLCSSAFAQSISFTKDNGRLIYEGQTDSEFILNGYKDGILEMSRILNFEDGVYFTDNVNEDYELRLCNTSNGEIYDVTINQSTPSPTETPVPTKKPEQEYNPNIYPEDIYDRALDAYYAFAMIDSVSTEISQNSEEAYKVYYACQNTMKSEFIEKGIEIISASDNCSYALGSDASALKKGDIVYFDRQLNGEIKSISLIYRPPSKDIITDGIDYGNSFETLFSDNGSVGGYKPWSVLKYGEKVKTGKGVTQYAFGMNAYKTGKTLYLINKSGNLDTALEITLKDKTAVYVCDFNSRGGVDIESTAAIGSNISGKEFYAGGTISLEDGGYSYVLVRLVDGMATDIAYYQY